ncbi:MAG: cell division protein ZapA [Rickettsiales bacterium]|jgi:cell division protein ZapA (FtsZ GTPase activity inhibitor)|nr:cell division protein ZapA [Rickettsiales bacterium]
MSTVALKIANNTYAIGCEDGQESRLIELSRVVDARAQQILDQIGDLPDETLLATTCVVLADELSGKAGADTGTAANDTDLEEILARIKRIAKSLSSK